MKPILIIETGRPSEIICKQYGDYSAWILQGMSIPVRYAEVLDVTKVSVFPQKRNYRAVVVTGSSQCISEGAIWSENTAAWLAEIISLNIPLLGICYGHQLIAHALGGYVAVNPLGREMGTITVQFKEIYQQDPLFYNCPKSFAVQAVHNDVILTIPDEITVLAGNMNTQCQILRVAENTYGMQFHPEFSAQIMRKYIIERTALLQQEHVNAEELYNAVQETKMGRFMLRQFAQEYCSDLLPH